MTGRNVIDSALKLLGYSEANGNIKLPQRIINRGTTFVNVIYSELARAEGREDFALIKNLGDEVKLSDESLTEIMPAGLAMLIAQSEGDSAEQQLWADIYNRKRTLLSRLEERGNGLPVVFDE